MTMRVALVSLDQRWEDKEANLALCDDACARAAAHAADMVVFPEMTLTGFTMNATSIAEHPDDSPTIRAFTERAQHHDLAVAFGVVLHGSARPTNSMCVVARDGSELARYAKIHPFSHARETEFFEAGSTLATADVGDITLGLTICYDLRFPELYSTLAGSCAALLCIANWPQARIQHWHTLLTARAIDNQCYMIGVNRTGTDGNGIHYPSSSQIIDPRGEPVREEVVDGDVALFTIEARTVAAYRRAFPTLRDRRPELYESLRARMAGLALEATLPE
jgi:predicted amidohydrolase